MGSVVISLSHTTILFVIALICCQFCTLIDTVSDFFKSSSKLLVSIKHPLSFKKSINIEKLVDAVSQLISTSAEINGIYTHQLLIVVLMCYVSITSHLYYIYLNASSNIALKHFYIPGDCLMILYRFFLIWRTIHSATSISYKSKEFNVLLYQLMIEDTTNDFLHNEKLKLHIAMKREVVFTACGFFKLDYTLLHSMIASVTTYLVILIQFGEPVN
ncbi:unnamed protein product [Nezara viridula]|uniref:Gustatory receptor n=1 Tax=Nezara viridula TaxID=85310 RepID=A0A9P0H8U9_NEZVI|nr:unnamed protein product [Nezara viridula]